MSEKVAIAEALITLQAVIDAVDNLAHALAHGTPHHTALEPIRDAVAEASLHLGRAHAALRDPVPPAVSAPAKS